jgi:hypothetical protein
MMRANNAGLWHSAGRHGGRFVNLIGKGDFVFQEGRESPRQAASRESDSGLPESSLAGIASEVFPDDREFPSKHQRRGLD